MWTIMAVAAYTPLDHCLLCGATDDLTVEHMIPAALWERWGIDPETGAHFKTDPATRQRTDLPEAPLADVARYCTTFCLMHNGATSKLHSGGILDLIAEGGQPDVKTLRRLAEWAIWVTMLIGLHRGDDPNQRGGGILPDGRGREVLRRRFDADDGRTPGGYRVYAAQVDDYDHSAATVVHRVVLLYENPHVLTDQGSAVGQSSGEGPMNAAEVIGLGKFLLLVLGRTHPSGRDHNDRLDDAASSVGLELIHPLVDSAAAPPLVPNVVNMNNASRLFWQMPFGADTSLLSARFRDVFFPLAEDAAPTTKSRSSSPTGPGVPALTVRPDGANRHRRNLPGPPRWPTC
jgi:hypothetical protein